MGENSLYTAATLGIHGQETDIGRGLVVKQTPEVLDQRW